MNLNFFQLELEVAEWSRRNFGPGTPMGYRALLGVVEEVGELSHAHLKQLQGIRGTPAEHEKARMRSGTSSSTWPTTARCGSGTSRASLRRSGAG